MIEAPPPIDPVKCNDPWARNMEERVSVLTDIVNLQAIEMRRLRGRIEQLEQD